MIRSLIRITLAVSLAIALAFAGWSVWLPHAMLRQVGLPGWRPESGRRCEDHAGTPWRHCFGTAELAGRAGVEDRVSFNRHTGRIIELERVWRVSDSADMIQQEDSVGRALASLGGMLIDCPLPTSPDGGAQRIAAWRFHEQDVRLIRSRWRGTESQPRTWMIQIAGFPIGYSGCQSAGRTRRLLTPTEMLGAVQRWLVDHTD